MAVKSLTICVTCIIVDFDPGDPIVAEFVAGGEFRDASPIANPLFLLW